MRLEVPGQPWTVCAIDPGNEPTICVLWDRGNAVRFYDEKDTSRSRTPGSVFVGKVARFERPSQHRQADARQIAAILEWAQPHLVVIEHVWVRPGQGGAGQAKLVYVMGICMGVCAGLGLNVLFVRPQTWVKYHQLPSGKGELPRAKKARRLELVRALRPELLPTWIHLKKHHNRADAFLMAWYGMRVMDDLYTAARKKGAPSDYVPEVWQSR